MTQRLLSGRKESNQTNKLMTLQILFKIQNIYIIPVSMISMKNVIKYMYEGHPISSDNGLISQKLSLKSEFFYSLHVAMGVAYSCLKYGVFVIT